MQVQTFYHPVAVQLQFSRTSFAIQVRSRYWKHMETTMSSTKILSKNNYHVGTPSPQMRTRACPLEVDKYACASGDDPLEIPTTTPYKYIYIYIERESEREIER